MAEVEVIKPSLADLHIEKAIYKNKKKKVCAYCRVSTDMEDQRTSYYSQINHYTEYIKNHKDWIFVGIYADEGITGTQIKNRQEFIRMIDDCKLGKIDMIIAKSISRFARNTVDTLNTVRELRELDIDVFFEKENIHTLNMDSEMFLTLYSAFAQAESESTSMNVKMGYTAKMKRGEPCGSIACYGYTWNKVNKKLEINEKEAKNVRIIFDLYLKGYGTTRLVRKLNELKIKSPNGNEYWNTSVLKALITNVKYVGDVCGGKFFVISPMTHKLVKNRGQKTQYYAKNQHKAIIDRETFEKAQKIYEARSYILKDGKRYCEKYSLKYCFSSKIMCGYCGRKYCRRVTSYKNKDGIIHNHVYWSCMPTSNSSTNCTESHSIRDEELKSLFASLFNKMIGECKNDDLINKIRNTVIKDNSEEKITKINRKIDVIKEKMTKLLELNLENNIDTDVFFSKNNELKKEVESLEDEKIELEKSKYYKTTEEKRLNNIEKEIKKISRSFVFDEEIFKLLVDKIIVGEYTEKDSFDPNVIKFILNIKNIGSNNEIKFLSLGCNEWVC